MILPSSVSLLTLTRTHSTAVFSTHYRNKLNHKNINRLIYCNHLFCCNLDNIHYYSWLRIKLEESNYIYLTPIYLNVTVFEYRCGLLDPFLVTKVDSLDPLTYQSCLYLPSLTASTSMTPRFSHDPLLSSSVAVEKTGRCTAITLIGCDFFIYMTSARQSWEPTVCFLHPAAVLVRPGPVLLWVCEVRKGGGG